MKNIKAVILCGGRGTRMNESTARVPKPLIEIDENPILWHIMKIYSHYRYNKFVLCLGYKGHMIENYFKDNEDFAIDFVDTGIKTGTAGRIKAIQSEVDELFFVTYGDGLSDVDIDKLLDFHVLHGKIATVTAVRPLVRFGLLDLDNDLVKTFKKYSQPTKGWIDGGFFVFNKSIFKYLKDIGDEEMLEGRPLELLAKDEQLMAYKHEGYWQCIDTYRDLMHVQKEILEDKAHWKIWK